jgi:prolyl oligopeptidase
MHEGKLYLLTNIDAPRYRIAAVDPGEASNLARWRDVVPQGEWAIEDWAPTTDRMVVHTIEEVRSVLRVYRLDGRAAGTLELPSRGSVDGLAASRDGTKVAVTWSSFFFPPALYTADVRRQAPTLERIDAVATDIDTSAFELEQTTVPSRDGTPINVFLVHRRGLERNGTNPVLLTGYGGFNVSLLPGFARNALYWLERGGIYAVANLRGGGEGGEQWHRAGNLGNKQRVFEDFEAVIGWLSTSGWSRPDRIGITGGSNGGLLMGAMLTRVPEKIGAVATYVGLYDMLRYDRFPPAELWVTEYGSARTSEEQFRWLEGYSPYHHVREGTRYPAVLVETADHDSRVFWGHSTKFAARMQEANAGDRPIWFYLERQVGHGAGTRLTDLVRRYDRMYAFFEDALGMRTPAEAPAP